MSNAPDSSAQQKRAQMLYQTGKDAMMKGNLDYAIEMVQEACKLDPGNLEYRMTLRVGQRKKFGNDPAKVGRLVGAKNQPIRMRAKSARTKGNFAEALETYEQAFLNNPWDVTAARDAAEAAVSMGLKEMAKWYLESVMAQAATDLDYYRYLAEVYELNGDFARAINCWEKVRQLDPNDQDARHKINALSASATIHKSGLDEASSKPAESSGPEEHKPDPEETRLAKMTPEARLVDEIKKFPDRIGPYLGLVEIYRRSGKLDEAQKLLVAGLKVNVKDPTLLEAQGEIYIARLQKAIAACAEHCRLRPADAAAKAKLAELTKKLNEFEVQEYQRRAEHHPDDLSLHYEVGMRLARVGRNKEAIAEFQQARGNPALKVQALYQAGLCFEADGLLKLAERNLQEALKGADPADHPTLNAINYRLGRVAEAQGNIAVAEEHYNEVAANDYNYQDVAQRLRSLA